MSAYGSPAMSREMFFVSEGTENPRHIHKVQGEIN